MRTYLILSLIGISFLCLSFSCGKRAGSIPAELVRADSLLAVCPDSAARYLASLDSLVREEPERVRMYYALQKIKADDKCYVTHTTDSVIRAVVRYYTDAGDPDLLMEAYYYLGSVYRDMGDPLAALRAFHRAVEVGERSDRFALLGRIYEQMGYVLAYQSLYPEAMEAMRKSSLYYGRACDTIGIAYARRNQARLYLELGKDSVDVLYREAIRWALARRDSSVVCKISGEFAAMLINMEQDYEESERILLGLPEGYKRENAIVLRNIGDIYLYRHLPDSARHYYRLALQVEKDKNVYLEKEIYQSLADLDSAGDARSAFRYERWASLCSDSILKLQRTEAIKKYNYQRTKIENQRLQIANARHQSARWSLGFLLLLVSAISVFVVNHYWRKSRGLKLRALQIQRLSREQERGLNEAIEHLRKELLRMRSSEEERIRDLKTRLEQYERTLREIQDERERQVSALEASAIFRFFSNPENQNHKALSPDKWLELRMAIDRAYPNFTALLQTYYLSITEQDLRLCYLVKIGVSPNGIASIFNCSPQAVASKRSRLYEKIRKLKKGEGKAKDFDKFILGL